MSDIQPDLFRTKEPGVLMPVVFGQNGEYRAHPCGLVETRKYRNGRGLCDEWRALTPYPSSSDKHGGFYLRVQCEFLGIKSPRVHFVICSLFHGEKTDPKMQVNHISGDRTDNSASNLEWVTPAQNIANAVARGAFDGIGACQGFLDDSVSRFLAVVTQINAGVSNEDMAWRYGVSASVFSNIKHLKTWPASRHFYLINGNNPDDAFGADIGQTRAINKRRRSKGPP